MSPINVMSGVDPMVAQSIYNASAEKRAAARANTEAMANIVVAGKQARAAKDVAQLEAGSREFEAVSREKVAGIEAGAAERMGQRVLTSEELRHQQQIASTERLAAQREWGLAEDRALRERISNAQHVHEADLKKLTQEFEASEAEKGRAYGTKMYDRYLGELGKTNMMENWYKSMGLVLSARAIRQMGKSPQNMIKMYSILKKEQQKAKLKQQNSGAAQMAITANTIKSIEEDYAVATRKALPKKQSSIFGVKTGPTFEGTVNRLLSEALELPDFDLRTIPTSQQLEKITPEQIFKAKTILKVAVEEIDNVKYSGIFTTKADKAALIKASLWWTEAGRRWGAEYEAKQQQAKAMEVSPIDNMLAQMSLDDADPEGSIDAFEKMMTEAANGFSASYWQMTDNNLLPFIK